MTGNCEFHGEFTFLTMEWLEGYRVNSCCQKCMAERENYINQQAKEKFESEKNARIAEKLKTGGVSARNFGKSFDSYTVNNPKQKEALDIAWGYADAISRDTDGKTNVLLLGTPGTGKTHLAHAITNHCILSGKACATIQLKTLIAEYRASWSDRTQPSSQAVVKKYGSMDGLVIDELGVDFSENEKSEIKVSAIVFEIMNERYDNQLTTVLISNQTADEVKRVLGERTTDRLREDGIKMCFMKWESMRGEL